VASVATYLNFMGNTEEAFTFYKEVFGTEFQGPIMRLGDGPAGPGAPALTEAEQQMIMHIELPILGGHVLMGTDMLESMGQHLRVGNNTTLSLMIDTREETERLYGLLSQGSTESAPLSDMPWGYWGVCLDRFSVRWMFNGPAA
jgi:PhnB protein